MEPVTKSVFEWDSSDSGQSPGEGVTRSFSESNYSEPNPNAGENLGPGAQASEMASAFRADLPSNPFEDDSAGEGVTRSVSESNYSEPNPNAGENVGSGGVVTRSVSESNYSEPNPNERENPGPGAQASEMASAFSTDLPSNPFEDDSEHLPSRTDSVGLDCENEEPSRPIVRLGSPMGDEEDQGEQWPRPVETFHLAPTTVRQPRPPRRIHPASSQAARLAKKQTETPTAGRSEAEAYLSSFRDPESAQHARTRTAATAAAAPPPRPRRITRAAAEAYLASFHDPESDFSRSREARTLRRSEAGGRSDRVYLPDSTVPNRR